MLGVTESEGHSVPAGSAQVPAGPPGAGVQRWERLAADPRSTGAEAASEHPRWGEAPACTGLRRPGVGGDAPQEG